MAIFFAAVETAATLGEVALRRLGAILFVAVETAATLGEVALWRLGRAPARLRELR